MKYITWLSLLLICSTVHAQIDSVYLRNGSPLAGKVLEVRPETVLFEDSKTNLKFEFTKNEIEHIRLSSGDKLVFEREHKPHTLAIVLTAITATVILIYVIMDASKDR